MVIRFESKKINLMKKVSYVLFLFSFIFCSNLMHGQRSCNSMEVLDRQIEANPERALQLEQIERIIENYQENENSRSANVYTIPVVFHVVYRNSTQNISMAQIQSQLDVLNEDFQRLNSDADNTWPQAGNPEISFCLATVDPNGNSTNGITRTSTSSNVFTDDDKVKFNSQGGKDAWPTSQYLNFWVCALDGFLGYAQFPGGPANTDGVVCDYRYVGTTGTAEAPFDLGRTATHEVGHWLNLYHIWGDGGCGVDDEVSDTPKSDAPNYGCTANHSSCNTTDMVQNYMDYSDDACMNLFTNGQITRMRALFSTGGPRAGLLNSPGCGGSNADTEAPSNPTNLAGNNTTQTTTDLSWNASSDNVSVTGYNVFVNGNQIGTSANTSFDVTGLTAGTLYTFSISAFDAAGNTSGLTSISFATLPLANDTEAPTDPTNLAGNNTTSTTTGLSWNSSTDNIGVIGYFIYVDGVEVGTSATTNFTVTSLTPATNYTFGVAAYDAAGNVSGITSISFSTLPIGNGSGNAGVLRIIRPARNSCISTFKPKVRIKNYDTSPLTSVTIAYSAEGQSYTKDWNGNLAPGAAITIALDLITVSEGSHQFVAKTMNPNGGADSNPGNDQKARNFNISGTDRIKVIVKPDDYGSEITWSILDDNGNAVATGGPYADNNRRVKIKRVCLPEGCYTFRIEDEYGDGICCEYGRGYYRLKRSNNTLIVGGNGQYGSFDEKSFCIGPNSSRQMASNTDPKGERSLEVNPNPASTNAQIVIKEAKANSTLRILNTLGQVIMTEEIGNPEAVIDLNVSNFKNGIYIIQLDDGRKPITKKLMVFN
jgi:chitodextrinase